MSIEAILTEIFKSRDAGPFLFVGSGFSRRYLGMEDWKGLLSKFCLMGKPFEYYLAKANGEVAEAAKVLSQEFNEYWWGADEYAHNIERYKSRITDSSSALRIEISNYLSSLSQADLKHTQFAEEVALLSSLNVDGIITTNWDTFLEQLFPDYRVYIGQNELLFANPQEIGEIYKVHGCITKPESLILTSDDYVKFNERNPYLAAKLIAVFVEHPVVFIGYSASDPNISSLLRSISLCVGKNNIEKLRKNLIFIQRLQVAEEPGISDTYIAIDGVQIPLILVKTNDFAEVYKALSATKRKIPARVLRYCKEQLCELVKSLEPEKKLCVVDIDEIDQKEDVEFLVGVGVTSHATKFIGELGYEAIEAIDLIGDLLHENRNYDPNRIITNVIKKAGRNTKNVPVFKYLREIGVVDPEAYKKCGNELDKWVHRDIKEFRIKQYSGAFFKKRQMTIMELIDSSTPEQASTLIPFLPKEKIDVGNLKQFLIENEEKFDYSVSNYASYFRKLAALYDRLKWGW